jgi:ubiquinol-cytochrome c reductase iron-sulfur subunit
MSRVRAMGRWLLALLLAWRRAAPGRPAEPPPRARELPRRREGLVLALLAGVTLASVGFVLAYALSDSTQLLGIAIGVALAAAAGASIVASRSLVPQEIETEQRASFDDREAQERTSAEILSAGEGVTRRRMLAGGAGLAGAALGVALLAPAASLGPRPGDRIGGSPWRRGSAVVGEDDSPLTPKDVPIGSFVTAFPQGADRRELGSAVVLVRLPPDELELPAERADWAPQGVLAFSKICTHAGCAINLYRYPLYAPTSPGPALVCPCHYSTFDPARGGAPIFGPAGRPLPQLPLELDEAGHLVAAGGFSDHVGPAWSGVREQ